MKKRLLAIILGTMVLGIVGCGNRSILDTTYTFDYAIIELRNGEIIEGKVEKWLDYDSDQIQVTIDGKTYLEHISNVDLIAE